MERGITDFYIEDLSGCMLFLAVDFMNAPKDLIIRSLSNKLAKYRYVPIECITMPCCTVNQGDFVYLFFANKRNDVFLENIFSILLSRYTLRASYHFFKTNYFLREELFVY